MQAYWYITEVLHGTGLPDDVIEKVAKMVQRRLDYWPGLPPREETPRIAYAIVDPGHANKE